MNKDPHRYDDIIDLPRHVSLNRKHMTMRDRAAQFSPFAALSGYDDAVKETARLTETRKELSDFEKEQLDDALREISTHLAERPAVRIMYFIPDDRKEGGRTARETFRLKRIDPVNRVLITDTGYKIPLDDILGIEEDRK